MAVVLHTTHGDLPVLLKYAECPQASFNFLALCAAKYFDGCAFYRHIPGILMQTGDPTNTGKGGESVFANVPAEASEGSIFPPHVASAGAKRYFDDEGFGTTTHAARGTLSMAHRGTKPNTNASQFFILTSAQPSFDGIYTAFGNVDLAGVFHPQMRTVIDKSDDGLEQTGDDTLAALELAAAGVDEKNLVLDRDSVKITGATVLFNPFADGSVKL